MWGARFAGILLLGAAIAGCEDEIDFGAPIPGTFEVTYTPDDTLTLEQGQIGQIDVTATATGGYPGEITFTAPGVPASAGVVDSLKNLSQVGDITTGSIFLYVSGTATPGTYKFVIRGIGTATSSTGGTVTREVTATDTVVLKIVLKPGFTLSVSPVKPSIAQGDSTTFIAHVTRTGGYAGVTTVTTGSVPAGVTTRIPSPNDSAVAIVVAASPAKPIGTYGFTVTLSGLNANSVTVTDSFVVTVPTTVTIDPATCSGTLEWLAVKTGDETWETVTPVAGKYTFGATLAKTGVAFVTTNGAATNLTVRYFDRTELARLAATGQLGGNCATTGKTINGTFANVGASASGLSAQLSNSLVLRPGDATTFQLTNVLGTTGTLFGRQLSSGGTVLDVVYAERGVNISAIANNGSLPNAVDFASATNASTPVTDTITVNGISGETVVSTTSSLVNTGCTAMSLVWSTTGGTTMPIVGYQVDSLKMLAGETNYFTAIATGTDFSRTTSVLSRARTISMTLPDKLTFTTPEVLAGLYQRLRFVYTLPASLTQAVAGYSFGTKSVTLSATAAYLGGTAVNLATPNFTGLSGWLDTWAPAVGSPSTWFVTGLSDDIASCALLKSSTKTGAL